MNIITCYKSVPDEQDIIVNSSDGSLDFHVPIPKSVNMI